MIISINTSDSVQSVSNNTKDIIEELGSLSLKNYNSTVKFSGFVKTSPLDFNKFLSEFIS